MKPVPVDIVTGFLGAGKTTLLKEQLSGGFQGERVAVVMNELGDIGIDGQVITGLEHIEEMVELSSGCICCSIEENQFELAINELVRSSDPTLVVIETTGVADPGPLLVRAKNAGLTVDAVITVCDAANFDSTLREHPLVRAQVQEADFVVVTKGDVAGETSVANLKKRVSRINGRAAIRTAVGGRMSEALLFATSVKRYRERQSDQTRSSTEELDRDNHTRDSTGGAASSRPWISAGAIESFSYRGELAVDKDRFERFLKKLPASVYRAKGFVRIVDNPWSCLFNFTCGRFELGWIKLNDSEISSQAVFIGPDIVRRRDQIIRGFRRCEVE